MAACAHGVSFKNISLSFHGEKCRVGCTRVDACVQTSVHRLRAGRGKSVALEYYFRAIDEFTTLIPQLFDEAFSFFFFFFLEKRFLIIPFLFFEEISFSMDDDTRRRVSRDGMYQV